MITSPSRNKRRSQRTSIIFTLLFLAILVPALILFSRSRSQLKVEIVLASPPLLMPGTDEFYVYQPTTGSYLTLTQNFYRAEIQVRNLGSSSIASGHLRGSVYIEIMEAHSTNWISLNQHSYWLISPIIKPGDSMNFTFRIPASATKWRATCSYQRWFLPQRFVNHVLRDWLNLRIQVGDNQIHDVVSEAWILNSSTTESGPIPKS